MIGHQVAPGPCQEQTAKCTEPIDKTVDGNHGGANSATYGDDMRTKLKRTVRIVFFNPNGMGRSGESFKMACMQSFLERHSVDVLGLSETNVDWRLLGFRDSLWGRVHRWFEARKISVAHNIQAPQRESTYQAGGTALLTFGKLVYCKPAVGQDGRRLGRWSSILLNGKGEVKTRLVSVYCPCKNTKAGNSVYQQHLAYYKERSMDVCPINQFWADLKVDIQEWLKAGEQLIIGGDWNHPIKTVNDYLEPFNLTEVITSAHGIDNAPPTHNRGSKAIDGIYTNSTIQALHSGYLPFNKGVMSDHRMVWMDVPLDALIGFSMHDPITPHARRLKNKDPRVKKKYLDFLHNFCLQHNLYQKMASVYERTTFPLTKKVAADLEACESLYQQGMIAAEKRCRKLRRGAHPWSPTFAKARDLIKLWTMVKQRKLKFNISVRCILRVAKRVDVKIDFSLPMMDIKLNINVAWQEYKLAKLHAKDLRISFLRSLAKSLAEEEGGTEAARMRQLLHEEEQRRISLAVKFTTRKLFGVGLSRVLVPSEDGKSTVEVTGKTDLEKVLLKDNPKKYHKCEPYCDLLKGELKRDIGLCGDGPKAQEVLKGTYTCPPETTQGTKLFLEAMEQHHDIDSLREISARSSVEEFCLSWKRAREQASSAGKLHTGHYKAGCTHDSIRMLHFLYADILYDSGHSLDRHRQGIDVMLTKTENDFRLFRLRTIFLFDAQLNMNMGRMGAAGLEALIKGGDMADEQYSRPNRSAADHVVNRRLMFDYLSFRKQPYAMCSCDLAGNYDRIVHSAASLAMQRVGVPLSRIYGMFDSIQRMVKKVRTAYGDSEGTYGGDNVEWPFSCPPMGANQGNRIGPPIWSIISSTVFSILRKAGFGLHFIDALSREIYHLVGLAFVDDSDLFMGGTCSFKVSEDMARALQMWEEVMNATGQAVAPEKSWWYLVDFVWANGSWKFVDGETRVDLTAKDSDGKVLSLKRLVFSKAKKMLGVYMAPNGDNSAEVKYLKEKANKWADLIRAGHLGPSETWIALSTGIWKTILYPMAATTLSEDEIRGIIRPIMDIALPRMLINRNVSLAIRYGPSRLGGLGIPNPYYDQGIKKVVYLVEHLWKGTPTGKLISRNISSLCLECGIFGNFFTQSPSLYPWITAKDSWIVFTWAFMHARDIRIARLPCSFLSPARVNDVSLMDGFSGTDATPAILRKLNACRLFLQVVSLSDIALPNGKRIDHTYLLCGRVPPSPCRRNRFSWPTQPCPSFSFWKLWNEFVCKAFCNTNLELKLTLGSWINGDTPTRPLWDWYEERSDQGISHTRLWHNNLNDIWSVYSPLPSSSGRHMKFVKTDSEGHLSPDERGSLLRVTVDMGAANICQIICRSLKRDVITWGSPSPPFLYDATRRVSKAEFITQVNQCSEAKWFITQLSVPSDITELFSDFLQGYAYTVSDGSSNPDKRFGTACWRIESRSRRCKLVGLCIVPGARLLQNSFRSELSGLLGISICIWALARLALSLGLPPDRTWDVIVGCDGYSALERALLSNPDRLCTKYKHYDLAAAIMGIWRDIPCSSFPVFVKSHQDDIIPTNQLSRMELMNVQVDRAAKAYMRSCVISHVPIPKTGRFHFGVPTVTVNHIPVSSELYKSLMDHCTANTLRQYWVTNWSLTMAQANLIAWDGFERAMIMLQRPERVFVTKWLTRQVNVGPVSQRYDESASGMCLRCRKATESLQHCIRCSAIRPKVLDRLDHVYSLLTEYGTSPVLVDGIRICTLHWLQGSAVHIRGRLNTLECDETVDALCAQYDFGWFRFLQGQWILPLVRIQKEYFLDTGSSKSFSFWQGKSISAFWKLLCQLHDDRRKYFEQRRDDLDPSLVPAQAALETALEELSNGPQSLTVFYRHYFLCQTPTSLKSMKVSALREWLRNVRIARESDPNALEVTDDFSPLGQHRAWLFRK